MIITRLTHELQLLYLYVIAQLEFGVQKLNLILDLSTDKEHCLINCSKGHALTDTVSWNIYYYYFWGADTTKTNCSGRRLNLN